MEILNELKKIRNKTHFSQTIGISNQDILHFSEKDPRLRQAIAEANKTFTELTNNAHPLLKMSEAEQIAYLQEGILNFYDTDGLTPYVPLAACGPWVITTCGAVIYDVGGYGMLGFGHDPQGIREILAQPFVMTNVMTANRFQRSFIDKLRQKIGQTRQDCPYASFLLLNSGSEAMTLALRFSDLNAKHKASGRQVKFIALTGSFHGRTERPSQVSDSCLKKYRDQLLSFQNRDNLVTIEPNNIEQLNKAFEDAQANGVFFEAMVIEPVMGEGNPGMCVTPEFYRRARQLTQEMGSLLIVDSIQAGLRAFGVLSICDYPGFSQLGAPDIESFSKSLNAGQFPLSVLGVSQNLADLYVTGIYGNTMTSNPRALAIGTWVLDQLSSSLAQNIIEKGALFVTELRKLREKFPHILEKIQGTGLLFSVEITEKIPAVGKKGLETQLRQNGLNVIHGGKNAIRFTPVFHTTEDEISLVMRIFSKTLETLPDK